MNYRILILLLLTHCVVFSSAFGENVDTPSGETDRLSIENIEARITELEKVSSGDEATGKVLGYYWTTLNRLKSAKKDAATAESYKAVIETGPGRAAQLEQELARILEETRQPLAHLDSETYSLDELDQQLVQRRARVSDLRDSLSKFDARLAAEKERPGNLREELSGSKQKLEQARKDLSAASGGGGDGDLAKARLTSLKAAVQELSTRIKMLQLERLSRSVRLDLLVAERELAQQQLLDAEAVVSALRELIINRRKAEVQQARELANEAQRESVGKHAVIQRAARVNAEFSQVLTDLNQETDQAINRRDTVKAQFSALDKNYSRITTQLRIAGLNEALGEILLAESRSLPDTKQIGYRVKQRLRNASDARLQHFQVEDSLQDLDDLDARADALIVGAMQDEPDRPPGFWVPIHQELRTLLEGRRDLLRTLDDAYYRYLKALGDLELEQKQLLEKTRQYSGLLNENLFLIPSGPPVGLSWLQRIVTSIRWLLSVDAWEGVMSELVASIRFHPVLTLLVTLFAGTMLWMRPRMYARLTAMAKDVGRVTRDRFVLTMEALFITFALALPVPLVLYYTGRLLATDLGGGFSDAAGFGLQAASHTLFVLWFIRCLFVKSGLAESHFHWRHITYRVLRRNLGWFVPVAVLTVFMISMTHWQADEVYRNALGRLAFVVLGMAITILVWRLLSARQRALEELDTQHAAGWRWHTRRLVSLAVVTVPLLLVVLSLVGYYFTAIQLLLLLTYSLEIILVAVLAYNLLARWLLIVERRLAFSRAQTRKLEEIDAMADKAAAGAAGEASLELRDIEEIDVREINLQTRELLRLAVGIFILFGLWWTWVEITPAFGFLDKLAIWSRTISGPDGEQLVTITLSDIGIIVFLILIIVIGARNLPGLLEVTILQPFSLEAGNRYAIISIARYVLYATGFFIIMHLLGMRWSDIQWLVAAMGVGLGFGLKEIFANFFSGLIILFERPIRVGDTVTAGEVSGIVSRIRIRATTILDWDNKELVIPNQALVVEPVINWTLSETATRIVLPIGIAYGSDTKKAHDILMKVVTSHPLVLKEPRPRVFFLGFGDSSLDFEVRAFVEDRLHRMPLTHDLNMAMEAALRENDIEIPFPQRDLHLRSIDTDVRMMGSGDEVQ